MNYEAVRAAVEPVFDGWIDAPVYFDNQKVTAQTASWVRVTIVPSYSEKTSIACEQITDNGRVLVQVFTPLYKGSAVGFALAKSVSSLLQNKEFDRTTLYTATLNRVGDDGKGWHQVNVSVPFYITS